MKRILSFFSYRGFVLNIIMLVSLIVFIAVYVYLSNIDPNQLDHMNKNKSQNGILFINASIVFLIIGLAGIGITFGLNLVYWINKVSLRKIIKTETNIDSWLVILSIIPLIGVVVDFLIFKKTANKFSDRIIRPNNLATKNLFNWMSITQILFSIIISILLIVNVIYLNTNSLSNLGSIKFVSFIVYAPISYVTGIILLVTLVVATVKFFSRIIKTKKLKKELRISSKSEYFGQIFLPWLLTEYRLKKANYISLQDMDNNYQVWK
ncbi:hypothetical protein [Mycoplasma bradburyae]|uniref:hypothetical protein n=1 Tax=Mycoplasma bradburyae TaxID=2963128 RepID=UPI00234118E2|nr:hypothetical protein [Mycoplasma bradburyae]MDC4184475.1 hypothetical protein [Mycoplasma bradburyae]